MAVWTNWNACTTTFSTCSYGSTWTDWNTFSSGTAVSLSTGSDTWDHWNIDFTCGPAQVTYGPESEEARAERERLEAEREVERQAEAKRKEEAEDRAKELLLDLIGEDELTVYNETGRLFVRGRNHDYLIEKTGTVKRVEKDKLVDLCIHLEQKHSMPKTDNVIALKLLAEADEYKFNQLANNHGSVQLPEELPRAACAGRR